MQALSQATNPIKTQISKIQEKLQNIQLANAMKGNQENKTEMKKKKKISAFSLRYANEEINRRYTMEQDPIKQQTLNLTLLYQALLNIIYMVITLSSKEFQQDEVFSYAIFAVIFIILISFNYLIRRVASLNLLLFLLLIAYVVVTNFTNNNSKEGRRIDISFLNILAVMYVIDCWIQKSFLLFITVFMEFIFRSDIFNRDKIPLIIILPAFFVILYLNQRKNKLLFYDYFYQQKTLAASQKLLDHTLPCSVIVLSSNDNFDDDDLSTFIKKRVSQQVDNRTTKDLLQPASSCQQRLSVTSCQKQNSHKQISKPNRPSQQFPQIQLTKEKSQQQSKKTLKFDFNNGIQDDQNQIESVNLNLTTNDKQGQEKMNGSEQNIQNLFLSNNLQLASFNPISYNQNNNNNNLNTNNNINYQQANNLSSKNNINENFYNNTNNNSNRNKKTSFMQDILQKKLKVNFVNTTCLNTFQIQRDQSVDEKQVRQDLGRTDFEEPEELQKEILRLLSSIEVQTSEYNLSSMNKSNPYGMGLLQIGNKANYGFLNSQFILTNSVLNQNIYGIQGGEQSENNLNSLGNSKKVLISTSLLDIVKQKYNLLHQKYIHQIYSNTGQNTKNKNEKSIQDKYKNIDLDKEDVFVNCIYKNQKNAKALDIHIVEFQWIDEPAIMIVMTDISQQVRARRLQDLDSYKNELLATVTHDLKTPLNGMLSILEVAQELNNIDEVKNFIQIVHKNGILLNFLIMDILDYSAMIKGELRLIKQKFDISDALKDINDLIGFQAQQKNLKFIIKNYLEPQDCLFDSDCRRIKQILLNLTSNALKFTFEGEIVIILEKEVLTDDLIKITVKDTGVGIPDSLKPKLFKLYGTYDHNNGSNKHGVGLGLVITKKLASQVGPKDTLNFQSQEKVGTEFSFHLYKNLSNKSDKRNTFESPTNLSKNIKVQGQSYISMKSAYEKQSENDNLHSTNKKEFPLMEKVSEVLDTPDSQALQFVPFFPTIDSQNESKTPKLSQRRQYMRCSDLIVSNTQENLDTNGPLFSPRLFPSHPSHQILKNLSFYIQCVQASLINVNFYLNQQPATQKLKQSQFIQYQSTNQLGRVCDTDLKLNSSRGMLEELNRNNNLDSCVKVTESFDEKDDDHPYIDSNEQTSVQKNLEESQKSKSTNNLDQNEGNQKMSQGYSINQNRKNMSSMIQTQFIEAKELNEGEFKNYPRQLFNKANHLEQIYTPSIIQFQKPTRVLIVDDTYFNIIALKLMLKNVKNLIIEEAYNGQQALDILNKTKQEYQSGNKTIQDVFQIIFMDINMPIMDGIECTINIRKDTFYQDIKIIAVTAYSSASESQKCFDAGMDAHICKPISKTDCLSVLLNLNQQ